MPEQDPLGSGTVGDTVSSELGQEPPTPMVWQIVQACGCDHRRFRNPGRIALTVPSHDPGTDDAIEVLDPWPRSFCDQIVGCVDSVMDRHDELSGPLRRRGRARDSSHNPPAAGAARMRLVGQDRPGPCGPLLPGPGVDPSVRTDHVRLRASCVIAAQLSVQLLALRREPSLRGVGVTAGGLDDHGQSVTGRTDRSAKVGCG